MSSNKKQNVKKIFSLLTNSDKVESGSLKGLSIGKIRELKIMRIRTAPSNT